MEKQSLHEKIESIGLEPFNLLMDMFWGSSFLNLSKIKQFKQKREFGWKYDGLKFALSPSIDIDYLLIS